MSVDLVGSTAFKAKHGDTRNGQGPYPIWLNRTKSFYRIFPDMLANNFVALLPQFRSCRHLFADRPPQVWKTVGDEIIFCIGVVCLEHLAVCARAFVATLAEYGAELQSDERELDVKGCAWLASFPAPNATIVSASRANSEQAPNLVGDALQEAEESEADVQPGKYDFLGKSIDTGFRISKFAQASELALSIELAWLLLRLKQSGHVDFQFLFKGRESLKGVINNTPYPIVTIETERSVDKKELSALERNVLLTNFAEPIALRNYLQTFMVQTNVEIPVLMLHNEAINVSDYPKCFRDFETAWSTDSYEEERRTANAVAAENVNDTPAEPQATDENVAAINTFAEALVRNYLVKTQKFEDK